VANWRPGMRTSAAPAVFPAALLVIAMLAVACAWAQTPPRLQFPTPMDGPPPAGGWSGVAPPAAQFQGGVLPQPQLAPFDPYAAQPPGGGFAAPPNYPPPVPYGGPPPYPGGLDPRFAAPGPSTIYQPGPTTSPAYPYPNSEFSVFGPDGSVTRMMRFLQGVSLEHTWLDGESGRDLEINDTDLSATFAVPIFPNRDHPLLISPGFAFHFWDGPEAPEAGLADLPAHAYDAYIDFTWRPKLNELFAAELAFRPGIYADYEAVNSDSLRLQGRGLAFITITPRLQMVIGGVYIDRVDLKFLPAGGVIWTPHEKARYEIVFPKPKLSRYLLTSARSSDWWGYLTAEYGGGSWTIERAAGFDDRIDINDIRVMAGLEILPAQAADGTQPAFGRRLMLYFEGGYVFEREIVYDSQVPPTFRLPDTFMVRAGARF
jgi:hypothetical protein